MANQKIPPKDSAQTIADAANALGDASEGVVLGTPEPKEPAEDTAPAGPMRSHTGEAVDVSGADDSEIGGGTFVTDKKLGGHTVFGTLKNAASEWTEDKTAAVKNLEVFQKPEEPKVAPGTQRKEVIQKAVQNAQQVAYDDHTVVLERIKTFQHDAERATGKPFIIKPKEEKPSRWTHLVGDDAKSEPSGISSTPRTPAQQFVQRESITVSGEEGTVAPGVDKRLDRPIEDYAKKKAGESQQDVSRENIVAQKDQQRIVQETNVRTKLPEPEVQKQIPVPPPLPKPVPPAEPPKPPPPKAVPKKEVPAPPLPPTPSTPAAAHRFRFTLPLRYIGIGAIALVVVAAGIGGVWYLANRTTTPAVPVVDVSRFHADAQTPLTLADSGTALLSVINDALARSSGNVVTALLQVPDQSGKSPRAATASEFFVHLNAHIPNTFIRTLQDDPIVGGIRTDSVQPFIIVQSTVFDTAFAGMLDWEPFMSADLAPLYGTPVTHGLDTDARTASSTVPAHFIDTDVAGHHTRILRDENGDARILYSFVNQDTLVITTNETAFEHILDRL